MGHPCPHWHRIIMSGALTHMTPGSLRRDLIDDMTSRGHPPMDLNHYPAITRVHDYGLHMGGAGFVDEPNVGFKLFNLHLEFPCSHVQLILARGSRYKERRFPSGRSYFKHHGAYHALVFTPVQHRRYMAELEALAPRAESIAEKFFASKIKGNDIGSEFAAKTLARYREVT
jgi:hypothetical protein